MFRWLRKIEDKARGGVCFVEFGDEHDTEAAAVLQLRGAEIQAGDAFALVCRNVTAQVTVTLDGLDDVPAVDPGIASTADALATRRRRKALETVASAAAVVGEAAAVALTGSDADVLAASGTNSTVEAPAVIVGDRDAGAMPSPEEIDRVEAAFDGGGGPVAELPAGITAEDVADRIPLPAALPDAAADLAAHVAPVRSASDPWVKLDGVKLELFDGVQLWWQKFAGATAAENSARKAAQLIEEGAAPGRFSQITIAMRKGECPAD